jgi:uncharacterized protein YecA (UPF0149 family)
VNPWDSSDVGVLELDQTFDATSPEAIQFHLDFCAELAK